MIKNSTRIFLQAFCHKMSSQKTEAFQKYLSSSEKVLWEKFSKTYRDPLASKETVHSLLRQIHPSWMAPFLRTLPEKEISLFLAVLDPIQKKFIEKTLLYSGVVVTLTSLGKDFLGKTLLGYLAAEIEDLLPIEALPDSPLNVLLELDHQQMVLLVDLLGLHDLSLEIRQIIDKQKLRRIYDSLSPLQMCYLQMLSQKQESVAFTRMRLTHWQGDQEKLMALIHQRGGNRLAKALYGQDSHFLWYLFHQLDVENALLIKKLSSHLNDEKIAEYLIQQIVSLVTFIRENHG